MTGPENNPVTERILEVFAYFFIGIEAIKFFGHPYHFIVNFWNLINLARSVAAIWWVNLVHKGENSRLEDDAIALTIFFSTLAMMDYYRLHKGTSK